MDNHGIHAASLKRETAQDRLVSAMKAMLRKLPYSSIQVSMIASDAGLSRKSFYCYFASKDELLRYALEKEKPEGNASFSSLCRRLYVNRAFYRAVMASSSASVKMQSVLMPLLESMAEELYPASSALGCAPIAASMMMAGITQWLSQPTPMPPDAFLTLYSRRLRVLSEEISGRTQLP